jgi:uncharacterized repeat protein (TIGR01451 family)
MKRLIWLVLLVALVGFGFAQDNPVEVRLEIYVVSEVTTDDGNKEERFSEATTARPGQVVEYRLMAENIGDTTLPAGTVVITGPVPDGTTFVPESATPSSELFLTEYSADNGDSYSEPPVIVTMNNNQRRIADPVLYNAVRWTLLVPMEPGSDEAFIYRVTVN